MKQLDTSKKIHHFGISLAVCLALAVSGCGGGGGGGSSGNSVTVVSITLTPSSPIILEGRTQKLAASGTFSDNSTSDITSDAALTWQSSNTAVALVAGGIITAEAAGTATISASMDGVSSTVTVTVEAITNTVVLYIATSADTTQYFSGYNITVDSGKQTLFRYMPEYDIAELVDQNSTYSYAPSTIRPYTVDNRIFVRREVRPNEYIGSHTIDEYDPKTNQQLMTFSVSDPNSITSRCAAILGNTYYYRESRTYDYFYGNLGGDLKKMTIGNGISGSGTTLVTYGDVNNCKYNLEASNGILYDADYYDNGGTKYIDIYKRDLTTGAIDIAASKTWSVTNATLYESAMHFAFDNGKVYWARKRLSDGQVEIWATDMTASPSNLYAGVISGIANIHNFDASQGRLVIGDQSGTIFLYDTGTGSSKIINVGMSFYALQIL